MESAQRRTLGTEFYPLPTVEFDLVSGQLGVFGEAVVRWPKQ